MQPAFSLFRMAVNGGGAAPEIGTGLTISLLPGLQVRGQRSARTRCRRLFCKPPAIKNRSCAPAINVRISGLIAAAGCSREFSASSAMIAERLTVPLNSETFRGWRTPKAITNAKAAAKRTLPTVIWRSTVIIPANVRRAPRIRRI